MLFPQRKKINHYFCFLDCRPWWLVTQAMEQDMFAMLITQMEMEDVLHVYIILIKTGMPRYATSFYTYFYVYLLMCLCCKALYTFFLLSLPRCIPILH